MCTGRHVSSKVCPTLIYTRSLPFSTTIFFFLWQLSCACVVALFLTKDYLDCDAPPLIRLNTERVYILTGWRFNFKLRDFVSFVRVYIRVFFFYECCICCLDERWKFFELLDCFEMDWIDVGCSNDWDYRDKSFYYEKRISLKKKILISKNSDCLTIE